MADSRKGLMYVVKIVFHNLMLLETKVFFMGPSMLLDLLAFLERCSVMIRVEPV